jgi:hypothetical protein
MRAERFANGAADDRDARLCIAGLGSPALNLKIFSSRRLTGLALAQYRPPAER